MSHSQTKKTKFLWDMVQKTYDIYYEPDDYLEKLILKERNPKFKEALQDLDDFMLGY